MNAALNQYSAKLPLPSYSLDCCHDLPRGLCSCFQIFCDTPPPPHTISSGFPHSNDPPPSCFDNSTRGKKLCDDTVSSFITCDGQKGKSNSWLAHIGFDRHSNRAAPATGKSVRRFFCVSLSELRVCRDGWFAPGCFGVWCRTHSCCGDVYQNLNLVCVASAYDQ